MQRRGGRRRAMAWCVGALAAAVLAAGCVGTPQPLPSASTGSPTGAPSILTPTPTEAATPSPSPTAVPTPSATESAIPTLSPQPPAPQPPKPRPPLPAPDAPAATLDHAVWVHLFDGALKTRAGIRRVVADLDGAGATAILAEVVRRQDAYYDSDVLPRTADPALERGLDVLAVLIEEARTAGLEVHAWIPVAPTWHPAYADLPAPEGWVTADHGLAAPVADRWVTRTVDGTWSDYLDPALPEVRAHIAAVAGEIAARYDVDGVHLDYVRYASASHGYHPRALALYRAATGVTGTPQPGDARWSAWRRAQVDALVDAVGDAVDHESRDVVVSAAVIAWGDGPGGSGLGSFADTRAYRETLQDWEGWAESGLVDILMPMNYFREANADQAAWLRTWLDFQAGLEHRTGVPVVPGVAGYLNSPRDALAQVRLAHRALGSVALYSYQGSTDDPARPLWSSLSTTGWGG